MNRIYVLVVAVCISAVGCVEQQSTGVGAVPGPFGPFVTHYEIVDDEYALIEGDILVSRDEIEQLEAMQETANSATRRSRARRWPRGVVPYTIDASITGSQRAALGLVIARFNAATTVTLKPRTGHTNYLVFTRPNNANRCSSLIGMMGTGAQVVRLGSNCDAGSMAHEIGHAVGLWHEHNRTDRDDWVTVLLGNVDTTGNPNAAQQFAKYAQTRGADYGRYDYLSLMHYRDNAFAKQGTMTLRAKRPIPGNKAMGSSTFLSNGDRRGIASLYGRQMRDVEIVRAGYPADKCWDVPWGSNTNQVRLQAVPCNNGDNQRWIVRPVGSYFEIRNKKSNKCLDIPGGSAGYVGLQQFDCHGGDNQLWRLYRHGDAMSLRSKLNERCIKVGWNGALTLGSCRYPETFRLYVRPQSTHHFRLVHKTSGHCADVPGFAMWAGVDVQKYSCKEYNARNQLWQFVPTSVPRYYQIRSASSSLCLERRYGNVEQRSCNAGLASQRWLMPLTTTGATQLIPGSTYNYTRCLEVANRSNLAANWLAVESGCTSGSTDSYFWLD